MVPATHLLVFGSALFVIGLAGFLCRHSVLIMLMSVELMLNSVIINLAAFSQLNGNIRGQVFAVFVITVAAAEIAVGLAILILIYRRKGEVNPASWERLKDW
jgi:NADH-quinone oxidoreductase subunit K